MKYNAPTTFYTYKTKYYTAGYEVRKCHGILHVNASGVNFFLNISDTITTRKVIFAGMCLGVASLSFVHGVTKF
jgi:hypothetical protein